MAEPPVRYTAARAANVVLGLSLVAAVVCVGAGVLSLREGSPATGWILIGAGLLPLLSAVLIRANIRKL